MEHPIKTEPTGKKPAPNASQQLFMATVMTITWQLLIVVLVPFIGGHYLDVHHHTTPLWTLIGLSVALAAAVLVTYRAYQSLKVKTDEATHV